MTTPKRGPGRPATGHDPVRSMRVSDEVWKAYLAAAGDRHPEVVRQFFGWYGGLPGYRRPARPRPDKREDTP